MLRSLRHRISQDSLSIVAGSVTENHASRHRWGQAQNDIPLVIFISTSPTSESKKVSFFSLWRMTEPASSPLRNWWRRPIARQPESSLSLLESVPWSGSWVWRPQFVLPLAVTQNNGTPQPVFGVIAGVALTSGLTPKPVADDLGVGMSTLNKSITAHRDTDVLSKVDLGLAQENDRLRRGSRIPNETRETSKKAPVFFARQKP